MGRFFKFSLSILGLAVGILVVVLLHRELRQYDYGVIAQSLREISRSKIALALGLTAVSYTLLVGYDALALRHLGRSPGLWRTVFASFTAYVLSYNIGLSIISGTAVRLRLYSAWNYTAREIAQIVTFTSLTFWLGLFTAAGGMLATGRVQAWPHSPWLNAHT